MPYVVRATNAKSVAVATLEEAREACIKIVQPYAEAESKTVALGPVARICLSLMRKDWSGGTVGPLPDETTIEVEPGPGQQVMRQNLREWGVWIDTRRTLDSTIEFTWVNAFNAREANR